MPRILIIDDERSIRSTLREILEYEKYEIVEAEDGAEGLQLIKKDDFDLVMCDIKMPKMDGMEVLIASAEIKPDLPFIMISGHGSYNNFIVVLFNISF